MTGYRLAITLAIAQQALFAADMAVIHHLGSTISLVQIAFVRAIGGMVLALCLASTVGRHLLYTAHPWLQAARAASTAAYALIMILSLAYMPLGDAIAINFLSGPYVVLLAGPILGEIIGLRRGLAVLLGLGGALLIAHPGFAGFAAASWFYLVIIVGTGFNALAVVLTRYLRRDDSATTILFYVQFLQFIVFFPGAFEPFDVVLWPWMLTAAIIGPLGMYAGIVALRYADASTLAPYSYLRLALASAAAPLFFGEWPGLNSLFGAGTIIAACIAATKEPRWKRDHLASA